MKNAVLQGDALDILPALPAGGCQAVIADPPYFNVLAEDRDRQWPTVDAYLLALVFTAAFPAAAPNLGLTVAVMITATVAVSATHKLVPGGSFFTWQARRRRVKLGE